MRIAVVHTGTEDNHGVVQQVAFAFLDGTQFLQQIRVLLHVPDVDSLILFQILGFVFVM